MVEYQPAGFLTPVTLWLVKSAGSQGSRFLTDAELEKEFWHNPKIRASATKYPQYCNISFYNHVFMESKYILIILVCSHSLIRNDWCLPPHNVMLQRLYWSGRQV